MAFTHDQDDAELHSHGNDMGKQPLDLHPSGARCHVKVFRLDSHQLVTHPAAGEVRGKTVLA